MAFLGLSILVNSYHFENKIVEYVQCSDISEHNGVHDVWCSQHDADSHRTLLCVVVHIGASEHPEMAAHVPLINKLVENY